MNASSRNVFLFLIILSLGSCQNLTISTADEFISWLFNITINDIGAVANNFQFVNLSADDVTFLIYLSTSDEPVEFNNSLVNTTKKTKIISHGWQAQPTADWIVQIARNYHATGDYNVIAVNWATQAKTNYLYAASVVQYVGYLVGSFVWELVDEDISLLQNIHLIGHSLGAHIVGFAGQWIIENTGEILPEITGLDAAGPLFEIPVLRPPDLRLSSDDGEVVTLIHTDAGLAGVVGSYGLVDYYINSGGPIQPICYNISLEDIIYPITCSHVISGYTFADSIINPTNFEANKCSDVQLGLCTTDDSVYLGKAISNGESGSYNVPTNSTNNLDPSVTLVDH